MLGFFTGLVYANAWEWMIHKYLLHEEGRKKDSFWRFHYMEHHKNCRLNDNLDPDYDRNLLEWNAQSKEVVTLLGGAALHLPLLPIAPTFTLGVWTSMTYYYFAHKKCHQDSDWGRKNMPWHYDHHMGKKPGRKLGSYISSLRSYTRNKNPLCGNRGRTRRQRKTAGKNESQTDESIRWCGCRCLKSEFESRICDSADSAFLSL